MRGPSHGRVRLLAAAVIAAGLYVLSAQSQAAAQQTKRISCWTDEECQSYCEFKYHTQNVTGICNSPGGSCSCLF